MKKTFNLKESETRELSPSPELQIKRSNSQKTKSSQNRDSQTILRKNSLFLVNCLKTRYKEIQKKAHIG